MPAQAVKNWGGGNTSIPPPLVSIKGSATTVAPTVPLEHITVRPAMVSDMRQIEPLIRTFALENLMLPKTLDNLSRTFREFVVAVDPTGKVVACGALRIYTEDLAEICSLAVDRSYQKGGIGRKVVERLISDARDLDLQKVFALTLRPEFFGRLGFGVVPKEEFPLKVWADCRNCPKLHACDEVAVAMKI